MTPSFSYLRGLIPLIVCEYIVILMICRCSRFCFCKVCREDEIPYECENDNGYTAEIDMGNPNTPMSRKTHLKFEDTFESFHPWMKFILFCTRFLSFYYICGVSVVANYVIVGGHQWFTFSMWNTELLSIYFGCAVISSVYGIVYGEDHSIPSTIIDVEGGSRVRRTRVLWSTAVINFGRLTQILFEVCGGTAVYITIFAFVYYDPKFAFWNVSVHFITVMTLLLELMLNNMYVRADHFAFNFSWGFLYLIFIWPVVTTGILKSWPYHFLEIDTSRCYIYYTALVIADIVFYFAFYTLSRIKYCIRQSLFKSNEKYRNSMKEDDNEDVIADPFGADEMYKNKEVIPDAQLYDMERDNEDEEKNNEDDVMGDIHLDMNDSDEPVEARVVHMGVYDDMQPIEILGHHIEADHDDMPRELR